MADDTLAKIQRADLDQNVTAWVALIHMFAENGFEFLAPAMP